MSAIDLSDAPNGSLPEVFHPMLATLAEEPFEHPNWIYEIKWDGYRAIATVEHGTVKLRSRNDLDFSIKYPPVAQALSKLPGTVVLDGEIVVLDETGKSQFGGLQMYGESGGALVYEIFDIMHLDGHDLTSLPLLRRKAMLKAWLPESPVLRYSDHVVGAGKAFFDLATKQQLEGIMAKDGSSSYSNNRSKHWLKIKTHMRQEAVIGGYTAPRGSRSGFGALILGVYDQDGQLQYIGHTGGGFNDRLINQVLDQLKPLGRETSPFNEKIKVNAAATWVEPTLVCEIQFAEWTGDGHMRQPIFVGMRTDKSATDVHRERAVTNIEQKETIMKKPDSVLDSFEGTDKAPIHHPDKVYWPASGITKGQLAGYYRAIAPVIMPYLKDRPQSMNRFPGGIEASSFFQKNVDEAPEWVRRETVHSEGENRDLHYVVCDDLDTLMYMVNLGVIEINPWNSRIQTPDDPDWCVIDLDPEDIGFEEVIKAANVVRSILEKADIPSYPKTSGATGMHIYMPMGAKYTYEQVKDFAHVIVQMVHAQLPDTTSLERSPAKRPNRIYLDFLQNRRGQTLAAPYCVRPKPGATVSTPLKWEEVTDGLDPKNFTVENTLARIDKVGDLWKPVLGEGIDLLAAIKRLGGQ